MKAKPSRETLTEIVDKLDGPVADLVRKDSVFGKLGLAETDYVTPEAVVELLVKHPKLMQRPVVMTEAGAVIGRPKDRVGELLDRSAT
jgi:arsenate reductase (glutaredoxin)